MRGSLVTCLLFIFFLHQSAIGQQLILTGRGYEGHVELSWNAFPAADRYQIWKKAETEDTFSLHATTSLIRRMEWLDRMDGETHSYQYFLKALNVPGAVLDVSDTITVMSEVMSDDQYLDMVQAYTFRYFYDYAHPVSGLARERYNSGDVVTIGGSGFGMMGLIVGVHRGFITREQGANRMLRILSFLQIADRFHGVFPHWMNGSTGAAIPFSQFDNGGDLVETAFLMQGLLCARAYFSENNDKENTIRQIITTLWEDVEWDFYSRNNSGVLYWHWSPEYQWQMNFRIRGYNEALIVYLLAIASPTHPVDPEYYHDGWAGGAYVNGNTWYGHKLFVGPHFGGPLFFAHYSFMGFDPRHHRDVYAHYFEQNQNHTLINRGWCIANPLHHDGYDENTWGLTASDNPWGYSAHAPGAQTDNGTLTPAAGIPSMPYTPNESIELLKNLYRQYGKELWGEYGFYDAFHPGENWYADSYLAIDQGPILNMIENYRSGLLWDLFMSNPEINPALEAIGFTPDTIVSDHTTALSAFHWSVFPNPSSGLIHLELPVHSKGYTIRVANPLGDLITPPLDVSGARHTIDLSAHASIQWPYVWIIAEQDHRIMAVKLLALISG